MLAYKQCKQKTHDVLQNMCPTPFHWEWVLPGQVCIDRGIYFAGFKMSSCTANFGHDDDLRNSKSISVAFLTRQKTRTVSKETFGKAVQKDLREPHLRAIPCATCLTGFQAIARPEGPQSWLPPLRLAAEPPSFSFPSFTRRPQTRCGLPLKLRALLTG